MISPPIIAVDFDGTLVEHKYPEIGETNKKVLDWVISKQREGSPIILLTCRGGESLIRAIEWCALNGIVLSAVNEDIDSIKISEFGKTKSSKIYANIYVDDRGFNPNEIK